MSASSARVFHLDSQSSEFSIPVDIVQSLDAILVLGGGVPESPVGELKHHVQKTASYFLLLHTTVVGWMANGSLSSRGRLAL